MNHHVSPRTRAAALGFAVLAILTTTAGTAQAFRAIPEAPALLAPVTTDVAAAHLVTSTQAANVRVELQDLRSRLAENA